MQSPGLMARMVPVRIAGLIFACVLGLLCKHENLLCSHLGVDRPKVMSLLGREGEREDKGVKDSPSTRHLCV